MSRFRSPSSSRRRLAEIGSVYCATVNLGDVIVTGPDGSTQNVYGPKTSP